MRVCPQILPRHVQSGCRACLRVVDVRVTHAWNDQEPLALRTGPASPKSPTAHEQGGRVGARRTDIISSSAAARTNPPGWPLAPAWLYSSVVTANRVHQTIGSTRAHKRRRCVDRLGFAQVPRPPTHTRAAPFPEGDGCLVQHPSTGGQAQSTALCALLCRPLEHAGCEKTRTGDVRQGGNCQQMLAPEERIMPAWNTSRFRFCRHLAQAPSYRGTTLKNITMKSCRFTGGPRNKK